MWKSFGCAFRSVIINRINILEPIYPCPFVIFLIFFFCPFLCTRRLTLSITYYLFVYSLCNTSIPFPRNSRLLPHPFNVAAQKL